MRILNWALATALTACVIPTPVFAHAGAIVSSSGVMQIRVYIPPIADSLRATETGANGLWTVKGQHGGLMIALGREGTMDSKVTIYSRETTAFKLSWDGLSATAPGEPNSGSFGQLVMNSFAVPKGRKLVRTFTIAAL